MDKSVVKRLGDLVNIKTGKLDANASAENGEYPFFTCSITPLKINSYSYDCECVLVAGNGDLNVKYYNGKFDAYQRTYIIESKDKEYLNTKYLYYFMSKYIEILRNQSIGGVIKYIKLGNLTDARIPVPSLKEQLKVVEILDKAKKVLDKRKEAIDLLDELVKSKFIEMFGDPVQNPLGWQVKPFLDSGNCKNGMNFSATETGVELQYLGVGDFKDLSKIEDVNNLGKVSLNKMPSTEYLLQDGDIVFVRSNGNKALVGRCLAVYPNGIPTTYSGFCIRYRKTDKSLEIPYLLQVLKTDSMRKNMAGRGANIQNLNQKILGELMIPIPPIELQNQFVDFVKQVDKLKFKMEKSLKALENNFNSLMQKAFEGELRL